MGATLDSAVHDHVDLVAHSVHDFSQLIAQKKPVIFYWWTPEYRNAQLDLVEVKLPPRGKNCEDDGSTNAPIQNFRCAYSTYPLEKVFSSKFAKSGSPAIAVLKRWAWPSNSDQNMVASWIAGQHMDPAKAAKKYVDSHMSAVNKWLGK